MHSNMPDQCLPPGPTHTQGAGLQCTHSRPKQRRMQCMGTCMLPCGRAPPLPAASCCERAASSRCCKHSLLAPAATTSAPPWQQPRAHAFACPTLSQRQNHAAAAAPTQVTKSAAAHIHPHSLTPAAAAAAPLAAPAAAGQLAGAATANTTWPPTRCVRQSWQ